MNKKWTIYLVTIYHWIIGIDRLWNSLVLISIRTCLSNDDGFKNAYNKFIDIKLIDLSLSNSINQNKPLFNPKLIMKYWKHKEYSYFNMNIFKNLFLIIIHYFLIFFGKSHWKCYIEHQCIYKPVLYITLTNRYIYLLKSWNKLC